MKNTLIVAIWFGVALIISGIMVGLVAHGWDPELWATGLIGSGMVTTFVAVAIYSESGL